MTDAATSPVRLRIKPIIVLLIGISLVFLIGANAHLLYVAASSQPECVDHLRRGEIDETNKNFSAAKSSCSPKSAKPTKQSVE